jgi:hypothetical protein
LIKRKPVWSHWFKCFVPGLLSHTWWLLFIFLSFLNEFFLTKFRLIYPTFIVCSFYLTFCSVTFSSKYQPPYHCQHYWKSHPR